MAFQSYEEMDRPLNRISRDLFAESHADLKRLGNELPGILDLQGKRYGYQLAYPAASLRGIRSLSDSETMRQTSG